MKRPKLRYLLVYFGLSMLLFSCNVNKYLAENERLIKKNKIKIEKTDEKISNKSALRYSLQRIAKPRPNRKLLGLFQHRLSSYYKTKEDKSYGWIKRWMKNSLAERPALYDSSQVQANVQNMRYFLMRQGFMDAQVKYVSSLKDKSARIKYNIDLKNIYKISTMKVFSQDSSIQKILNQSSFESFLKPGAVVSQLNYDQEVNRIGNLLRNRGYAAFLPIYVDNLRGDSLGNYRLEILQVNDSISHPQFQNGNIHVYLRDLSIQQNYNNQDTIEGIIYHYTGDKPYLKTELISRRIQFRPNQLYQKSQIDLTRVQLGDLTTLRRVTVTPKVRGDQQFIDYNITIQRNPRYNYFNELTAGYVTIASDRNRIGITGSTGLTNNNLFGGGEVFSSELIGGLEFNLFEAGSSQSLINTNLQFNNSLNIPSFKTNLGLYWMLNKIGLSSKEFRNQLHQTAHTKIRVGTQFLNFTDFYSYKNFEIDLGHNVIYKNRQYRINQTGLVYWNPKTSANFDITNINNPNLRRSFEPRLLTGIFFRSLALNYQSPFNRRGEQFTFLGQIESSGHEAFIANQAYRWISGNDTEFSLGNVGDEKLRFAHFFKFELDGRYFKRLGTFSSIAARADLGVAIPYGFRKNGGNVVPYVNQFGAGGPYSIRAWETRELGPGGLIPPDNASDIISFAQKGDLKLELNLEYRFNLFWYFRGAFFIDAGNVWLFKKLPPVAGQPPTPPEGIFSTKFLNQMAIGGGYGVRFDYNFFVVRVDMGYKFRQPFDDADKGRWLIDNLSFGNTNFNFAIGYPF